MHQGQGPNRATVGCRLSNDNKPHNQSRDVAATEKDPRHGHLEGDEDSWEVHTKGKAVAEVCHKELAELYVDRLREKEIAV